MSILKAYYQWRGRRSLAQRRVPEAEASFLRAGDIHGLVEAAEYEAASNVAPQAVDMLNQLGGRELLIEFGEKWLLSRQTILARRAFELSGYSEGLARVAEEQLANGDSEMALSTFQAAGRRDRLIELADSWLQAHEDALAYRGYELAGCRE